MYRDNMALKYAIRDKIRKSTFNAIVTECFLEALPFDDIERKDKKNLSIYVSDVMESLTSSNGKVGGFSILEKNIALEKDPLKKQFYSKIYDICNEAAIAASNRIVAEEEDSKNSIEDILERSGLNEEEIKDFKENVDSLNTDKMSDVIQRKVIDTIRDEQKQQKEAEELNQKLREAIAPEPSEEELADRAERMSDDFSESEESLDETSLYDEDEQAMEENEEISDINDGEEEQKTPAQEGITSHVKYQVELSHKIPQAKKKLLYMSETEFMNILGEYCLSVHGISTIANAAELKKIFTNCFVHDGKGNKLFESTPTGGKQVTTSKGTSAVISIKDSDGFIYYAYGFRDSRGKSHANTVSRMNIFNKEKEGSLPMSFLKWYAKTHLMTPEEKSTMPATEGFLENWKQKRLSRKLDMIDIDRLDQNIFCDLVGEYVADHVDMNYIIYDPILLEEIFKRKFCRELAKRNEKESPRPNIVVVPLGDKKIAVFSYYDPINRREIYGYGTIKSYGNEKSSKMSYGYNFDKSSITLSYDVESKKIKAPKDQKSVDAEDCKLNFLSKGAWSEKLLKYYQNKYKNKTIGIADEAVIRFYRDNFSSFDAIRPITFFSRLQDYALESYVTSIADDDKVSEIPYNSLYRTTFQSNLPCLHKEITLEEATESLIIAAEAINAPVESISKEQFDKSVLISMVIYTVLETLKTLGLYNPSFNDMKSFISTGTSYNDSVKMDIAKENIKKETKSMESMVRKCGVLDAAKANRAIETVDYCLEHLNMLKDCGYSIDKEITALENLREDLNNKIRIKDYIATESIINEKEKTLPSAISGLNKLNMYYGNRGDVDSIEIYYNSTATESYLNDVIVRATNGVIVDKSFIDIRKPMCTEITMESILKDSFIRSNLKDSSKKVKIIDKGKGNRVISLSNPN